MKFALVIAAVCGLASAVDLSSYQVHHKTPLGADWKGLPINVSRKFLSPKKVPFVEHPAGNSSWLGMNFDYQYIKPIFNLFNSTEAPLLTRGDSHITVISPPEFAVLAAAGITIDEVNAFARQSKIQSSKVTAVCLGKEDVLLAGVQKVVYQILVKSPDLVKIREKIFLSYVKKGGNTALFDPQSFWPHITVGFSSSDLFIEQGVYKGANVCYRPINLTK